VVEVAFVRMAIERVGAKFAKVLLLELLLELVELLLLPALTMMIAFGMLPLFMKVMMTVTMICCKV
jgi:hypothetical protein